MIYDLPCQVCGELVSKHILGSKEKREDIASTLKVICPECKKNKSRREGIQAAIEAKEMGLPPIEGTKKQIIWGEINRLKIIKELMALIERETETVKKFKRVNTDRLLKLYKTFVLKDYLSTIVDAHWWINNRKGINSFLDNLWFGRIIWYADNSIKIQVNNVLLLINMFDRTMDNYVSQLPVTTQRAIERIPGSVYIDEFSMLSDLATLQLLQDQQQIKPPKEEWKPKEEELVQQMAIRQQAIEQVSNLLLMAEDQEGEIALQKAKELIRLYEIMEFEVKVPYRKQGIPGLPWKK